MYLVRLADYLERKYQLNSLAMSSIETNIRNGLDSLWNIPNKAFNILRACADADASNPKNQQEELAVKGFQFCQQVVGIVDYLKANRTTLPLKTIKKGLEEILALIKSNMSGELQFPHVSELIFQIMPYGSKHDRKIRDQEYAKARKGLSRLTSISISLLSDVNKLGGAVNNEAERFEPIGAKLSNQEIMAFIRQYGTAYGIPDLATWSLVLNADPELEKELTKTVHALLRGHSPINTSSVKSAVLGIINQYHELNQPTNNQVLQQEDPEPMPLLLNEKFAMKYGDL